MGYNLEFFHKAVVRFDHIRRGCSLKNIRLSPTKKMIWQMAHAQSQKRYRAKTGNPLPIYQLTGKQKRLWREVLRKHDAEVLSMTGVDLEIFSKQYDIDPNLPTKVRQEAAFQAFADDIIYGALLGRRNKLHDKRRLLLQYSKRLPIYTSPARFTE